MLDRHEASIPEPLEPARETPEAQSAQGDWPPPRRATSTVKPAVDELAVHAYVIFDHAEPDLAGTWIDRCAPDDSDAAYLLELYETRAQARAAMRPRAGRVASEIFPLNGARAASSADDVQRELTVRSVTTRGARGRDYRRCSCDTLPEVMIQIRVGERHERAWREIIRQRAADQVDGALLPGPTPAGTLFVFITADVLLISPPL